MNLQLFIRNISAGEFMKKKIKLILLFFVVFVSLGAICAVGYFALAQRKETAKLADAGKYFRMHDYARAKPLLAGGVGKDPANESAYRMLAEIFESEFDFRSAAYCYKHASSLAPLDSELRSRYVAVLSLLEQYPAVISVLKTDFEQNRLSNIDLAYYTEALIAVSEQIAAAGNMGKLKSFSATIHQYLEGVSALKRSDLQNAHRFFSSLRLAELPDSLRYKTLLFLGSGSERDRRSEEAERYFRTLADEVPALGAYPLADHYIRQRKFGKAIPWLEKTLSIQPKHTLSRVALAELLIAEHQPEKLGKLIAGSKPDNQNDIEIINYMYALLAFSEGRRADILPYLELAPFLADRQVYRMMKLNSLAARKEIGKLVESFDELGRRVHSPEAREELLQSVAPLLSELYNSGDTGNALKIARAMIPVATEKSAAGKLAMNIVLAEASRSRNYEEMQSAASSLLKAEPGNPLANLAMGEALLANGNALESLSYFNNLPEDDGGALIGKALACARLGKEKEAETYFEKAWRKHPGNMTLFRGYGDFLFKRKEYRKLQSLYPALPDTPEAAYWKYFLDAEIAGIQRRTADSRKNYAGAIECLKKMPPTPANLYQTAFLYARIDQDEEAARIYRGLLKENPDSLLLIVNLSEVEAALGNHSDALLLAERALRLEPQSDIAKECLARRKAEAGKQGK